MKHIRTFGAAWIAAVSLAASAGAAPVVPRTLALALNKAQAAYAAHDYSAALERLHAIQRQGGLDAYQDYLVERSLGSVAAAAGAYGESATALASALHNSAGDPRAVGALAATLVYDHYQLRDYAAVIADARTWSAQLQGQAQIRPMLLQAYASTRQCAALDQLLGRGSRDPAGLASLAACYQAAGDARAEYAAVVRLLRVQPSAQNWKIALALASREKGAGDRYALDLLRLRSRLGLLDTASQSMNLAMLELEAQDPRAASSVLQAGYKSGVLGTGAGAPRQARLVKLVDARLAAQPGQWARIASASRTEQLNAALAMVDAGQVAAGLTLLKKAEGAAPLPDADLVNLRLAQSMAGAGRIAQAHAIARSVALHARGTLRDIAGLWQVALDGVRP